MEMRFVWLLALAFVGMSAAAHSQSRINSSMDLAVNSGEGKGGTYFERTSTNVHIALNMRARGTR